MAKSKKVPGVIGQLYTATRSPVALIVGLLLGGFVPCMSYHFVHNELDHSIPLLSQIQLYIALGGLIFSAKSVFQWARMAFNDTVKASGFVLLAEGVMTTAKVEYISVTALVFLVIINAVATGCVIATDHEKSQSKK